MVWDTLETKAKKSAYTRAMFKDYLWLQIALLKVVLQALFNI